MYLLRLFLFLWLFTPSSCYEIVRGVNETLYEPPRINLRYTGAKLTIYVRLCKYSVTDQNELLWIRMTRYCYCTHETNDSSCSYPGPTLLMHDNTTINVTVVNQLRGKRSTDLHHNEYKDMDVTNLHVHGLHVNPRVDDVLLRIQPNHSYSQSYPYDIQYHYPGTHWYHAHHHGSTTYQVNMGLHGALLMTNDDPYEVSMSKYKESVLMFNWFYTIPASICNNNERAGPNNPKCDGTGLSEEEDDVRFTLRQEKPNLPSANYAMCDIYCNFPVEQLAASGYVYDVETNISINETIFYLNQTYNTVPPGLEQLMLFFTNGQISPIIRNLTVGIYHRLRFVNSLSNWYLQFKFPDECDWHLIATDGIYIGSPQFMNYNLSNITHQNELIMSTGGRADVMVRCQQSGVFPVYSSEKNVTNNGDLNGLQRVYGGKILFSIEVNDRTKNISSYHGADSLPTKYAPKPKHSYIEDLSDLDQSSGLQTKCDCYHPLTGTDGNCSFSFGFNRNLGKLVVNNRTFGYDHNTAYPHLSDALMIIEYNKSYEFILETGTHVYHQHINPFQIPSNTFIGKGGFIALPLTWWDALGYNGGSINMRFWTRNYDGLIITHCHLLQHEDEGMMGFYDIWSRSSCPFHKKSVEPNNTNYMSTTIGNESTTAFIATDTSYYTTTSAQTKKGEVDGAYTPIIGHLSICILCIFCVIM